MTMPVLPKYWPSLGGKCEPEVEQAIRLLYNGQNDHEQAITNLNAKTVPTTATTTTTVKASSTTITEPVASAPTSPTGGSTQTLGGISNQTGTSYALLLTDNGGLVTFNNAAAVACGLPTTFPTPFFTALENLGAGTVTVTPVTGLVNGAANIALATNQSCIVFFDGVNWWATTAPAASGGGYSLGGTLTSANVTLGSGAGTGGVLNTIVGLDGNHYLVLTVGTSPATGAVIYTVTFTASRGHASQAILSADMLAYVSSLAQVPVVSTSSPASYSVSSYGAALTAGNSYRFSVSCP
jgi:hypothetical protein